MHLELKNNQALASLTWNKLVQDSQPRFSEHNSSEYSLMNWRLEVQSGNMINKGTSVETPTT